MNKCTCPTKYDAEGKIVPYMTNQLCPVHGQRAPSYTHRVHQNCPTCTCREPVEKNERDS